MYLFLSLVCDIKTRQLHLLPCIAEPVCRMAIYVELLIHIMVRLKKHVTVQAINCQTMEAGALFIFIAVERMSNIVGEL